MIIKRQYKAPWDWFLIIITTASLALLFVGSLYSHNLIIKIILSGIALLAALFGFLGIVLKRI